MPEIMRNPDNRDWLKQAIDAEDAAGDISVGHHHFPHGHMSSALDIWASEDVQFGRSPGPMGSENWYFRCGPNWKPFCIGPHQVDPNPYQRFRIDPDEPDNPFSGQVETGTKLPSNKPTNQPVDMDRSSVLSTRDDLQERGSMPEKKAWNITYSMYAYVDEWFSDHICGPPTESSITQVVVASTSTAAINSIIALVGRKHRVEIEAIVDLGNAIIAN